MNRATADHGSGQGRASHAPADVSLLDIARTLDHWRALVLGCVGLGLVLAIAGLALVDPVYEARAVVLIEPGHQRGADDAVTAQGLSDDDAVIDGQARVLASRTLAEEVVADLARDGAPGFTGDAELQEKARVESFLKRLDVARDGKSNAIAVTFRSTDPQQAAMVANRVAEHYIAGQLTLKYETTRRGTEWLATQLEDSRSRLGRAEADLATFRQESEGGYADAIQLRGLDVVDLKRDHMAAVAEVAARRQQLGRIEALVAAQPGALAFEELGGSAVLQNLHALKNQAVRRETELAAQYGPRHPRILDARSDLAELERQIATEQRSLVGRVRSELDQARARETALAAELDALKTQTRAQREAETRIDELKREVDLERRLYEGFIGRLQAVADIDKVQRADARLISPAAAPERPVSPRPALVLSTAFAASLATALMIVYLLEQGDRGFRTGAALEKTLGLPCLGLVPLVDPGKADGALPHDYVLDRTRSRLAETMRGLLAALHPRAGGEGAKVLLVTSAVAEEGKSTLVLSLARTAAEEGLRVLLIDADLRRPRLHAMLGHRPSAGLPEMLRGEKTLEQVLRDDPRTPLRLLPASHRLDRPTRLLGMEGIGALLHELRPAFDLILVDSAPLLAVADGRLLARAADEVLVVCRWNATPCAVVAHCIRQLRDAGATIAGCVLGRVDLQRHARLGSAEAGIAGRELAAYYAD
ncbi:MAG: AAA family ATPase [Geminicoccaceae bacterium]|nr:AAA family ATPase [Geminicoccaceae bacterium]